MLIGAEVNILRQLQGKANRPECCTALFLHTCDKLFEVIDSTENYIREQKGFILSVLDPLPIFEMNENQLRNSRLVWRVIWRINRENWRETKRRERWLWASISPLRERTPQNRLLSILWHGDFPDDVWTEPIFCVDICKGLLLTSSILAFPM